MAFGRAGFAESELADTINPCLAYRLPKSAVKMRYLKVIFPIAQISGAFYFSRATSLTQLLISKLGNRKRVSNSISWDDKTSIFMR